MATSRGKYAHSAVSWRSEMKRAACRPQLCTGRLPSKRSVRIGMRISADQPVGRRIVRASQFSSHSHE